MSVIRRAAVVRRELLPGAPFWSNRGKMKPTESKRIILETAKAVWKLADPAGPIRLPLHLAPDTV